jgi:uncharacterized membrane protein/protein-disulfide isomerase
LVTHENKFRLQESWPYWRWALTGLNIIALVLSFILSWHYMNGGSMPGCGGGSPCDMVLSSRWSRIAGLLPVSGLAMGVYLAMLVAGLSIGPTTDASVRRLAWSVLLILAGSVVGSALWFTYVQKWVIGQFCVYCMSTHATGLLLAALIIWRATKEFNDQSADDRQPDNWLGKKGFSFAQLHTHGLLPVVGRTLIGLALAAILTASQMGFPSQTVYSNGESRSIMPVINYHDVPMIGSPNAPFVVTLLYDYDCPHCQKLHLMLDEAVRRFDGKLAFALCPTPLNPHCNPYVARTVGEFRNSCELAKIALAVWVANRKDFTAFDDWMYAYDSSNGWHPRSPESAMTKAVELVGKKNLDAALSDPWIGQYMQTCTQIFGQTLQNGEGGVPKLIFGPRWVIPEPRDVNDLVAILQKSLGIPKP